MADHAKMVAFQEGYLFRPNYNYNGKLVKLIFCLSLLYYELVKIYYGSFSAMANMHIYRNMTFLRNSTNKLYLSLSPLWYHQNASFYL